MCTCGGGMCIRVVGTSNPVSFYPSLPVNAGACPGKGGIQNEEFFLLLPHSPHFAMKRYLFWWLPKPLHPPWRGLFIFLA